MKNRKKSEKSRKLKRTRLTREDRRSQLLDLAVNLCSEIGLSRISHADIAEKAGVSVPTVFSYFPNKASLVQAILDEVLRFSLEIMNLAPRDIPAKEVIFTMLRDGIYSAEEKPQYLKIWVEWGSSFRNDTWPSYVEAQRRAAKIMESILQEGQKAGSIDSRLDTGIASRILADGANSVASLYFMGASEEIIEAMIWNWVDGALKIGLTHTYVAGGSGS